MKIIFLDIDGVLNWMGTEDRVGGFIGLDPSRIEQFNKIIEAVPDAKVVISSTWRKTGMTGAYEDFNGLKKLLAVRGLKGHIIGFTPISFGYRRRGDEIREWLEDCAQPGDTFVVLDDSTEGMEGGSEDIFKDQDLGMPRTREHRDLRPYHVVTFWDGEMHLIGGDTEVEVEGGLQDHHVQEAIKVLNGGTVHRP